MSIGLLNTNDNPQMEKLRLKTSLIGGMIARPFRFIPTTIRLYGENHELNYALFILNQENFLLKELEAENLRLRQMLNFAEKNDIDFVPAQVVGKDAGTNYSSISIDKGSAHGLTPGLPVMSSKGLAGQVTAVTDNHALCQIMLDNQFGAAVKIQRNRIDGILHWENGDICRLDGIPATMDVREGDILVTSGLGQVYPKGLSVGFVTKVRKEQGKLFQDISVEPFTDFHTLEEVFVILK